MGICGQKSTPTALTLEKGTGTDHVSEWETPESVRMGDTRVGANGRPQSRSGWLWNILPPNCICFYCHIFLELLMSQYIAFIYHVYIFVQILYSPATLIVLFTCLLLWHIRRLPGLAVSLLWFIAHTQVDKITRLDSSERVSPSQ